MAEESNLSEANEPASEDEEIEEIEEYASPQIDDRGSLNEVTQGASRSGKLDAVLPATSTHFGGGLFS
jgi:hypothetical protein